MRPAIIVSSHTAGLAVIRALGREGVPVVSAYYDTRDMGYVSKYVSERVVVPHPERHEEQFIRTLIDSQSRFGRALLIPADDASLLVVSRHKVRLADYFLVACTDYDITQRYIDKKHTYALASALGIQAPRTWLPATLDELDALAAVMDYPCLVKPCQSHRYYELFRCKLVKAEDAATLKHAYCQARAAGLEMMVQELIPGDDTQGVNYNSYMWDGEPLVEFTAAKVRLDPPAFGVPSVVVSRKVPEVIEPARRLLNGLGYHGFSCMEFKLDRRDGSYKLMELNGRHNRSALLAVHCGINFPWLEYRHLVHGERPGGTEFRQGVYWIDEFRDLNRMRADMGRGCFSLTGSLAPYLGQHVFAVLDSGDSRPFRKHCTDLAQQVWQRVLHRQVPDPVGKGHSYEK